MAASADMVSSKPVPSTGYAVVGATCGGITPPGLRIAVRIRSSQRWSTWTPLAVDADYAPDPESVEARSGGQGTDALVVGNVDLVQLRAASRRGPCPPTCGSAWWTPAGAPPATGTATAAPAGAVPVGQRAGR